MTSKQRLLAAIERQIPDRLPVTTHHVMPYFLKKYMPGTSIEEFFDFFGFDRILWLAPTIPDSEKGEYFDPFQDDFGLIHSRRIVTDRWRIEWRDVPDHGYKTRRYDFVTPRGTLSMVMHYNEYTAWVGEHLIKDKGDIDLMAAYMPSPCCDVQAVNRAASGIGDRGIVRGHICTFDVFGQSGCWQDAACLVGIERLILETYDDPHWVHELLKILQKRKLGYIRSFEGADYDILEDGGGDASSTVISPRIFSEFIAPYDSEVIRAAHETGQKVVYHTCGGMMPILEDIAAMEPDAMETFTPRGMGGDVLLKEAKERIGGRVCMIGGFDQFHFFSGCTPEETRAEVRRCFKEAGIGGGYILCPSDHFFDADISLIQAMADEARQCVYGQD